MGGARKLPLFLHIRSPIEGSFSIVRSSQPETELRSRRRASGIHFGSLKYFLRVPRLFGLDLHRAFSLFSSLSAESPDFSRLPGARKPRSAITSQPRSLEITSSNASEAFKHCVQLVKRHDFDNYVAALLLPRKLQAPIFSILALNVELALVRDKVTGDREGAAGVYRLQFWKDTLNAIYAQSGPVPRQPVAVALCSFLPQAPRELFENLVVARQQSLGDRPFASVQALESYGVQTTGALISLQVHALSNGSPCDDALEAARCLGRCYAPLNLLRATVPLLRRGIVLLPSDLLILHGLSADSVYKGKNPEGIRLLAKDLADVASLHLERARGLRSRIPRGVRPAFLATGATSDNLLGSLRSSSFDLFHTRLQRGNPLIAWQLWWRNFRGIY